ncbi:MASE1 domain-containing protein [Dyella jiangningensis]|uniref:MASE1 domain-containing protein n=1 Tax=Dyella jiangningensis TaxID=1379159 RepID=UPI00240EB94A|nr:MASE1 domain-containing protein [Dyella jiangningensis]MDG2538508.1 MASE1 domain-containing protein [Dyella jiangningensis]
MKGRSIQRGLDMQKGTGVASWLRQFAAAATYLAIASLFRELSISHWLIVCGLHVSVLLLTPYRYWAALAVGDMVSLGYLSITCADQFGVTWAVFNLVPSLALAMPVIYLFRERWPILVDRKTIHAGALLACALLVSAIRTADSLFMISITKLPENYPPLHYGFLASQWMLGNYMGALTVAPFMLMLNQVLQEVSWRDLGARFLKSRLAMECVFLLVPTLAFLVGLGLNSSPTANTRQLAQLAMFLPVVWLTMRYGWQGATVGGTLASLAVVALMPKMFDPDTLSAQVFIAFIISTMMLMGARIGALNQQAQQERTDLRMALALAQRNMSQGEVQLRMTSQALEQVRETVHAVYNVMLGRLRHMTPVIDDRSYRRQALVAQDQLYRLADSLCPVTSERGLPAVLREGPIARMLDETGIAYWCDLRGPVSVLSATIHLAIYRLVCEAVADGCTRRDVSDIRVQVRCGRQNGRLWTMVRINLRSRPDTVNEVRWDELLPRVLRTATGLGWPAIEDRAATFEGRAREHLISSGRCISVLLFDPEQPGSL